MSDSKGGDEITTSIIRNIPGGQLLIDWFGGWIEFGDGEVVELRLQRHEPSILCVWAMVSERGHYGGAPFKAAVVSFQLRDVLHVAIQGFSHQNVIEGLLVSPAKRTELHESLIGIGLRYPDHEITLQPLAGAFGTIQATIEAITIEPVPFRP